MSISSSGISKDVDNSRGGTGAWKDTLLMVTRPEQVQVKMQHLILLITSWVAWIKSHFPKGISVASECSPWNSDFLVFLGCFPGQEWLLHPSARDAKFSVLWEAAGCSLQGCLGSCSLCHETAECLWAGNIWVCQIPTTWAGPCAKQTQQIRHRISRLTIGLKSDVAAVSAWVHTLYSLFFSLNCSSGFSEHPNWPKPWENTRMWPDTCKLQLEPPAPAPTGFAPVPSHTMCLCCPWDGGASLAPQTTTNTHKTPP